MSGEWLLIETLGEQPAIVAHGTQAKKFVPVPVFIQHKRVSVPCAAVNSDRNALTLGPANKVLVGSRVGYDCDAVLHLGLTVAFVLPPVIGRLLGDLTLCIL